MSLRIQLLAASGALLAVLVLGDADVAAAGRYRGGHGRSHSYGGHSRGGGHRSHYGHRGHGGRSYGHHGYRGRSYGHYSSKRRYYGSYGFGRSYYSSPYRSYRSRSYYRPRYYGSYGYRSPSYGYGSSSRSYGDGYSSRGYGSDYSGAAYPQSGPSYGAARAGYGSGWSLLSQGQYANALNAFAQEAETHPTDGAPKMGYALASAATGDLERGVWAMRRACRIDPESMHDFTAPEGVDRVVEGLIGTYNGPAESSTPAADSAFMLASLHYLNGDMQSAHEAITQAADLGDRSPSANNLAQVVEAHRAAEPADDKTSAGDPPLPALPAPASDARNAA